MESKNPIAAFNQTIDHWIEALASYSQVQLCDQPGKEQWSIGQVYMHLINETEFYIREIEVCLADNKNSKEEMNMEGKILFQMNGFPEEKLKRPKGNPEPQLPENNEKLLEEMKGLKLKLNLLWKEVEQFENSGKTRHPGFLYFNAKEWFQFAEMHLRHHLRQKEKIDNYLKNN
jgi:hypothetical protein